MDIAQEIALPKVKGSTVDSLPENLYIPPKALLLLLDVFSGPMDFLLYLVQRKNLDILEVNLVEITDQYIAYIDMMEDFEYELAGDYLAMAAYLAEVKSRILLPREEINEEEEDDPKAELIRRLQEYKRFKDISLEIDSMPRIDRDIFPASAKIPEFELPKPKNNYEKADLVFALKNLLSEMDRLQSHKITFENITVESKMKQILNSLKDRDEALLLAANRPLSIIDFKEMLEISSEEEESEILNAIFNLQKEYENRPSNLVEVSNGYRLQIKQEFSEDIAKLWEIKPLRLSKATLETLSIIAYMQPVTRGDIEDIRGVNVATNVVKLLIDQGWIKIKGYRDVPGRPALFITTNKFLDDFSMKDLDDLPKLPELPDPIDISPELALEVKTDQVDEKEV